MCESVGALLGAGLRLLSAAAAAAAAAAPARHVVVDSLIVVIDGDREDLLGRLLPYYLQLQVFVNLKPERRVTRKSYGATQSAGKYYCLSIQYASMHSANDFGEIIPLCQLIV